MASPGTLHDHAGFLSPRFPPFVLVVPCLYFPSWVPSLVQMLWNAVSCVHPPWPRPASFLTPTAGGMHTPFTFP